MRQMKPTARHTDCTSRATPPSFLHQGVGGATEGGNTCEGVGARISPSALMPHAVANEPAARITNAPQSCCTPNVREPSSQPTLMDYATSDSRVEHKRHQQHRGSQCCAYAGSEPCQGGDTSRWGYPRCKGRRGRHGRWLRSGAYL